MRNHKKVLNYRPILFIAIALMAGVVLSLFALHSAKLFWWSLSSLLFLFITLILIRNYKVSVILFAFIIGFASHYLQYKTTVTQFNKDEYYHIDGRITAIYNYENYDYIVIDNLLVDGFKVKGKATLKLDNSQNLAVNDSLIIYGTIDCITKKLLNKKALSSYSQGHYYQIEPTIEIRSEKRPLNFFQKIKHRMVSPMNNNLTANNKGIACSLLFGDKHYLDYTDSSAIKATGLSHIFAVSGLHICFVVALITFLFKRLRINKWISLIIMSIVLFVYCGVTLFPPSALRACVMATIFMLSTIMHKKNDALSSLSTAIVFILLVYPATLFSLSFIMSVSAVFGIILFFRPINTFLKGQSKNKIRHLVSGSLALSTSANIFLLPVTINTFGYISIYFALANLIVLPIVTITYMALFISSFFSLITNWFGFLYLPNNLLISLIRWITRKIATLPFAVVRASSLGVFSIIYVAIMTLLSRFVLLPKHKKLVGVTTILFVGVLITIVLG